MPEYDLECVMRHVAGIVSKEVDGETVILDTHKGVYCGLNDVGSDIWRLLGEGSCVREVIEHLLATYEISRDVLERDTRDLVSKLVENGLLEIAG